MRVYHTADYPRARGIMREGFRDDRDGEFGEVGFYPVWLSDRPLYPDSPASPYGQVILCLDLPADVFAEYEEAGRPCELYQALAQYKNPWHLGDVAELKEFPPADGARALYEAALARYEAAKARAGDVTDEEEAEALRDAENEFEAANEVLEWVELRWAIVPAAVVNRYRPVLLYDHARCGYSRRELMEEEFEEEPDEDSLDAVKFLDLLDWPTPLVLKEQAKKDGAE
jgi:hypothetical protein